METYDLFSVLKFWRLYKISRDFSLTKLGAYVYYILPLKILDAISQCFIWLCLEPVLVTIHNYMNYLFCLQLASLKDTIARKDEEIERLHSAKDIHHPHRPQKPMVRIKSLGQTDDINSETGEYSSHSRHAVTDGESLASSVEAESEERLSEVTSDAASNGTQGSPDVAKRPPKISDRLRLKLMRCCGS